MTEVFPQCVVGQRCASWRGVRRFPRVEQFLARYIAVNASICVYTSGNLSHFAIIRLFPSESPEMSLRSSWNSLTITSIHNDFN